MTEYEYLNLLSTLREEGAIQSQFFVAIFSAYILAIYAVGKKLSTLSISVLTLCYTLFMVPTILSSAVSASNITAVARDYSVKYPQALVEHLVIPNLHLYYSLLLIFCWLLSVGYMMTTRYGKA